MSENESIRKAIADTSAKIQALRQQKAEKTEIDALVKQMQDLQAQLKSNAPANGSAPTKPSAGAAKSGKNKITIKTPKVRSH